METLVTNVIERQLKDLRHVKRLSSSSAESISAITIEFESGVDMDDAYQKTRDKVDKAKPDLPTGAEDPALTEINISEFPIMLANVYGSTDLVRLKQVAEGLEEQIETIPGVLDVDLIGGLEREIQIQLNPERLEFYGIGVGQVIGSIQREHLNIPGGKLELGDSKYLVRVDGEYRDESAALAEGSDYLVGQRALAGAGGPGDAYDVRLSAVGVQGLEDGQARRVLPFDHADQTGGRALIPGADALGGDGQSVHALVPAFQVVLDELYRLGCRSAGREYAGYARGLDAGDVVVGYDASPDDEHVVYALLGQ